MKSRIWRKCGIKVEKLLGGRIGLTDSYMMLPAAAVLAALSYVVISRRRTK